MYDIREAINSDSEQVFLLSSKLATSFVVEERSFIRAFEEVVSSKNSSLLVAESASKIIGYLLGYEHYAFYSNGRIAGTEEIFVIPDWRGKGVGRALMASFEKRARARGAVLATTATRRAAPFYEAIGYEDSACYFRKLL